MSTADTVAGVEAIIDWCVPEFAASARRNRLPGAFRGERFWHGKATVERHRHWVVAVPVLPTGAAAVTVTFDGTWAWVQRPDQVRPVTLAEVQAAFAAAAAGG